MTAPRLGENNQLTLTDKPAHKLIAVSTCLGTFVSLGVRDYRLTGAGGAELRAAVSRSKSVSASARTPEAAQVEICLIRLLDN